MKKYNSCYESDLFRIFKKDDKLTEQFEILISAYIQGNPKNEIACQLAKYIILPDPPENISENIKNQSLTDWERSRLELFKNINDKKGHAALTHLLRIYNKEICFFENFLRNISYYGAQFTSLRWIVSIFNCNHVSLFHCKTHLY